MPADMLVGRRLAIGALRSAVDAAVGVQAPRIEGLGDVHVAHLSHEVGP